MSAEVAQTAGQVVAGNVRRWRVARSLDQQGLADRLADLGWLVDRTAIVKIEGGKRKVSVDDLALLSVALNVPMAAMLTPIDGGKVTATPDGPSAAVHRWMWLEWMIGNEYLPGRGPGTFGGEWRSGALPLWLYDRVRRAQQAIEQQEMAGADPGRAELQELVDAVADMEDAGLPAADLIASGYRRVIKEHKIVPTRRRGLAMGDDR